MATTTQQHTPARSVYTGGPEIVERMRHAADLADAAMSVLATGAGRPDDECEALMAAIDTLPVDAAERGRLRLDAIATVGQFRQGEIGAAEVQARFLRNRLRRLGRLWTEAA